MLYSAHTISKIRFWLHHICAAIVLLLILVSTPPALATTPPSIISVPSGTLNEPRQVAVAGVTGSTIFLTTDGSTPTTSSRVYSAPIQVNYSLTIKAIAVLNSVSSTVSSASYTLDSTHWPAPDPGDASALKIELQRPTTAIPQ